MHSNRVDFRYTCESKQMVNLLSVIINQGSSETLNLCLGSVFYFWKTAIIYVDSFPVVMKQMPNICRKSTGNKLCSLQFAEVLPIPLNLFVFFLHIEKNLNCLFFFFLLMLATKVFER